MRERIETTMTNNTKENKDESNVFIQIIALPFIFNRGRYAVKQD